MLKSLQVERAKSKDKPYKLSDSHGLHLYVGPNGTRSWRYAFRYRGRAQLLSLGTYPEVSLSRAREKHAEARRILAEGQNPAELKQQEKARNRYAKDGTFEALSEQWYSALEAKRSASWRFNIRRWLDNRVYPAIGGKMLKDVQPSDVLAIIRSLEQENKARSAESMRQMVSQIYDYWIGEQLVSFNPAQSLAPSKRRKELPKVTPHPHLTERELPGFLAKVDAYPNSSLRLAVNLLLLTLVRRGELIGAKWSEIDMDRREWRISAERMKSRKEHVVPLSDQAIACFEELRKLAKGSDFILPSPQKSSKHIGRSLLLTVFNELDGGISPHGTRATASSILNERSGFSGDVIEAQLAHVERDQVRAAYNRAQWLEQRAKLMQWWGDYLDNARAGNVVQLPVKAA